jgi:hypothetical protein
MLILVLCHSQGYPLCSNAPETTLYDIATHYGTVVHLDQVLHRLRVLEIDRTSCKGEEN